MNANLLAASLLFLTLTTPAIACEPGNPRSLAYSRRDDNRCEGLLRAGNVARSTGLISLITGLPDPDNESLTIRIATKKAIATDAFALQARQPRYRLDRISGFQNNRFTFPSKILTDGSVPANSLRALATLANGPTTYVPVILDRPDGLYTFTFVSPRRASYPEIKIQRPNGETALTKAIDDPIARSRAFSFQWDYRNEQQGTYVLILKDSQGKTYRYPFEHNPSLL